MKPSITLPSFLLFLAVLLLFLLPLIQCDDLIQNTCKQTPHYDLCFSSLQSNSKSSDADVKGLVLIMANITLGNATDTLNYIHQLINQTTDPERERPLDYCAETYIPVITYILPQAIEALTADQYKFASYGISYAGKEIDSCQKKFTGSVKSPLTDRNQLMQDLCEIVVAILQILLKG